MTKYITTKEASEKWAISSRRIQILCKENRIQGALKKGGTWLIPELSKKPRCEKAGYKRARHSDLTVLSLFSGCGGMDLGFEGDFPVLLRSINTKIHSDWEVKKYGMWGHLEKTRFRTVFANDIREDAQIAWQKYFKKKGIDESVYYLDSIVDLVKLHRENRIDVFPDNVDVVIGGFPCQDFSIAGKRRGFKSNKSHTGKSMDITAPSIESRGQLYMWMREVIQIVKPKVFIAENVKGLANLEDVKKVIEYDFSTICNQGYIIMPTKILLAANYGVPQSRERIIFIGIRKNALNEKALKELSKEKISSIYDPYPQVTHAIEAGGDLMKYVCLKEVFSDLLEPSEAIDLAQKNYSKAKYMGKHCQGQIEVNLDGIAPTIRSEHHGNIEFRRLSKEHNGKYIEELNSGKFERRLTIRECARIQTFPDDYEFIINGSGKNLSASSSYKLIGNAVPPLFAYHIARRLEKNWELYFDK